MPTIPQGLTQAFEALIFLMLVANMAFQLRKWIVGEKPLILGQQPLMVAKQIEHVTRAEFDGVIKRLDTDIVGLKGGLEANSKASDARHDKLHAQIQSVSESLNRRIDDLPGRIITELSTLGLLRRPDDKS